MHLNGLELPLGWREILLALVFLLALYMLFELIRLRWLRRRNVVVASERGSEPALGGEEAAPPTAGEIEDAWQEASSEVAQAAFRRGVEYEVVQMRDEIDLLRSEFAAVREELQQEISRLRNSQGTSPFYNDAMQMAAAGHAAEQIAERCGISRAEADLVVALVNNPER